METGEGLLMDRGDPRAAEWDILAGLFDVDEQEQEWQERALCAQTDPEAFFPEQGGDPEPARRICGACPVRGQCRDYALSSGELYGIWGGLTFNERRRLRRRARRIGVPVTEVPESGRDAA